MRKEKNSEEKLFGTNSTAIQTATTIINCTYNIICGTFVSITFKLGFWGWGLVVNYYEITYKVYYAVFSNNLVLFVTLPAITYIAQN